MSAICGVYEYAKKTINNGCLMQMQAGLQPWNADKSRFIVNKNTGMACQQLYNTPESLNEILPLFDKQAGLLLSADVRLDNRNILIKKLNDLSNKDITDSEFILTAYKKWGVECVNHLNGDFAFALWDEKNQLLFCARDHFGVKPFYYYHYKDTFLFASAIRGIHSVKGIPVTLCEQWVADTLSSVISEKSRTPYKEIKRLPPAHYLIVKQNNINISCFWQPDVHKRTYFNNKQAYTEAFKEKLINAVRNKSRSQYPVGCELSGGLDSSGVTAIAADILGANNLHTFSHVMPGDKKDTIFPYTDEQQHIKKVLSHSNINHAHFITSGNKALINTIRKSLDLQGGPTQQCFHLFSDALLEKASNQGVRTILSGFGGDEMVTSQGQGFYNELAAGNKWMTLWDELKHSKKLNGNLPLVSLLSYYLQCHFPMIYNSLYKPLKKKDWVHTRYKILPIGQNFAKRINQEERYFNNKGFPQHKDVRLRQYHRITHHHVSQRLEYCSLAAGAHNIEYRYPLLDKELVEFYLSVPPEIKVHNGWGRYLYRQAMEGIIPADIQWRNDKTGATIPTVWLRFSKDYEKIKTLVEQYPQLDGSRFIDINKLENLQDILYKRQKNDKAIIAPGAFFNAIMFIIFQLENL